MVIEESGIQFEFPDSSRTIKFDDDSFYRKMFNKFPGSKAVDFVELGEKFIALIEVKNCLGDEGNCRWRVAPDNAKKGKSKTGVNVDGRDSLDIEVTQKAAMTLAALSGAVTFGENKLSLQEISRFASDAVIKYLSKSEKKKYMILFLEGDFGSKTRSKKMIMECLQRSMKRKLGWLNCEISVVDSSTYNEKIFKIKSLFAPCREQ